MRRCGRRSIGSATSEWCHDTGRARDLKAFISEQAWWVEDYALFRAIHASQDERPWTEWPASLQRREPADIDRARRELMPEVLFYQYMQWQATTQWHAARGQTHGVALFGDLPFMVDGDSADVWARQYQFRLDASIGAPPDAFSADGPELGHAALPLGRHRRRAFPVAARARAAQRGSLRRLPCRSSRRLLPDIRVAEGRRRAVFHAGRRADPDRARRAACSASSASPARRSSPRISARCPISSARRSRGSASPASACFDGSGTGTARGSRSAIPPSTRRSRSPRPGRTTPNRWPSGGSTPRRPSAEQIVALPTVRRIAGRGRSDRGRATTPAVRDALLEALFAAGSNLLLLPLIDAFGWSDRINEPATVGGDNWTFRLPWPTDRLDEIPGSARTTGGAEPMDAPIRTLTAGSRSPQAISSLRARQCLRRGPQRGCRAGDPGDREARGGP